MKDKLLAQRSRNINLEEIYGDIQSVAKIIYIFIAICLIGIIAGILIVLTTNSTTSAILLAWGIFPALISLYLTRRKRFESATAFLAATFIILNTLISTNGLGIHSINNFAYLVVLILGSLVTSRRTMIFLVSLTVLCIGWLVFGELNGWYTPGILVQSVPGDFLSASLIVILTAIMLHRLTGSLFQSFSKLNQEVIERRKLEENLRQREAILEAVAFAAEQFLKSSDWRTNIDNVLERLGRTINATHAYLFEDHLNAQGEAVTSMRHEWTAPGYASDMSNPHFQNSLINQPGFEEQVEKMRSGEVRAGTLSTFNSIEKEAMEEIGVRSILEVPVFVNGKEWGTIGFDDHEKEREWSNAEVDALKIAAGVLSAAIQRQKADSAVQESERIYRQAIEAAGAVPYYRNYTDERFMFVGDGIEKIIGYKPGELTTKIWDNIIVETIPLGEGEGLPVEEAIRRSRSGELSEWKSDVHIIARNGEVRWISDSAIELFNEEEISYASVGILQDITERKLTEFNLRKHESLLEAVTFAAEQFLKTANWRETIERVLERLGKEFNASHAYLFEKHSNNEGEELSSMTHEWTAPGLKSDLGDPEFQNLPMHSMGFERMYDILDRGEPLVASASLLTPFERDYLYSIGVKALLEIRVVVNGKQWGTLGVDDIANEREWESMEVDVIRVAAGVLGAAIERQLNDDLLKNELAERQKLIHELELRNAESATLRETTEIITSTLDISAVVEQILSQLKRVVRYDSASVWLYHGNIAEMMGTDGLPDAVAKDQKYTISEDEPDYPLWEGRLPYVLLYDIQENYAQFRHPPIDYIRGWLAVPLKVRGEFMGFISLDGKQAGQFTDHDAHLALNYANQVSIALENARLFSDLQMELGERKKLIQELEDKNGELERFTYTVSHDLKSPLVTIDGFLRYIERDVASGNMERFKVDMERVQGAVHKMQNLLRELLELSRIGRMVSALASVPFEELAREAMEAVHGRLEAGGVKTILQSDLPTVVGDRPRLLEVMQNLIDNAAKYMGTQPEPVITIGRQGMENDKPVFFVKDNGMGIEPQHHNRIFELFNKLDTSTEGTGVGLALVKRIIEVHGGRIWVESELGQGATFYFTLPVKKE